MSEANPPAEVPLDIHPALTEYLTQFPGGSTGEALRNIPGFGLFESAAPPLSLHPQTDGRQTFPLIQGMQHEAFPAKVSNSLFDAAQGQYERHPVEHTVPENWSTFAAVPEDSLMNDQWEYFIRDFGILDSQNGM